MNGRDRTKLVEGMHKQVGHVRDALAAAGHGTVPVTGVLCFLDADWGLLQRPFQVDQVLVTWPKDLDKRLLAPGAVDPDLRTDLQKVIASSFRPAT